MLDKIKELSEHINERVSNPFFFSYLASWIVVNYQIVFMALSDTRVDDKIAYIERNANFVDFLFCPFIGVILYLAMCALRIPYHYVYARLIRAVNESEYQIHSAEERVKINIERIQYLGAAQDLSSLIVNSNGSFRTLAEIFYSYPNEKITVLTRDSHIHITVNDARIQTLQMNPSLMEALRDLQKLQVVRSTDQKSVFVYASTPHAECISKLILRKDLGQR